MKTTYKWRFDDFIRIYDPTQKYEYRNNSVSMNTFLSSNIFLYTLNEYF